MRNNKKQGVLLVFAIGVIIGGVFLFNGSEKNIQESEKTEEHTESEHAEAVEISDESATSMGIETSIVGSATIRQTVRLSGRVVLNQNRSAAVKARFPGVIRGVFKQVGENVQKGEKLATVESNESLQTYAVPAPLSGVVLERTISVGDTATDVPMFTVADLNNLWAEFFIFAGDMSAIHNGQTVLIHTLDGKANTQSALTAIQPTAETSSQTVTARADINNVSGEWRPGMTIQGDVVTGETSVAVGVPTAALQKMEGRDVVFVRQGTRYIATPVTVGVADRQMTEISAGLTAGVEVVSRNSFVVKADIGKASAEHEH